MNRIFSIIVMLVAFTLSGCDISDSQEQTTKETDTVSTDTVSTDTIKVSDYLTINVDSVFVLDSIIDSSASYWSSNFRVDTSYITFIDGDIFDSVKIQNGYTVSYMIYKDTYVYRDEVNSTCVPAYVSSDSIDCVYSSSRIDFSLNPDSSFKAYDSVVVNGQIDSQTVTATARPSYFKVDIKYTTKYERVTLDGYSDCIEITRSFSPDLTVTFPDPTSYIPYRDPVSSYVFCRDNGLVKLTIMSSVWVKK